MSQCIASGLAYDGLAAPFAYDGLAGWAGRGLGCNGLAAPLAYDGLAGFAGRGLAYDGLYPAIAPAVDFTPTSGGLLPVSSVSAFGPVGISVASENAYEGALAVAGELPFVGTVGLEGVLPTAGRGAVNHACGNGINAMVSENNAFAPEYYGAGIAPAAAIAPGLGYRGGWAGRGCGCAL